MWIITNFGFFSVVEKPTDRPAGTLTIRGRVRADLEGLKSRYLPSMGPILEHEGTDYRYRATVARGDLAKAMGKIVMEIDYSNFKNSVTGKQGQKRAHIYGEVWSALYKLEGESTSMSETSSASGGRSGKAPAFGGVLFDSQDRILLRSPKNGYGGDRWTLPKGRPDKGETPEAAALREVLEETGYDATIVCDVPGEFEGDVTSNRYYVMRPVGEPGTFDAETEEVRWVSFDEAIALIDQKVNRKRVRDLAVIRAARDEYQRRR